MVTLLLRFIGPMQSWGIISRFDERDSGKEPSKSGVIGLIAAAMGIPREDWESLEPLTTLRMIVRHDRPGIIKKDYQTAGCSSEDRVMKADGKLSHDGIISQRYYIADAAFLIALETEDRALLEKIQHALINPKWHLSLGRKSYLPSETVWFKEGIQESCANEVVLKWPWISSFRHNESPPLKLLVSFDTKNGEGVLRMDQPVSSFSERKFSSRFVKSEWIDFPQEFA